MGIVRGGQGPTALRVKKPDKLGQQGKEPAHGAVERSLRTGSLELISYGGRYG